MALDPQIPLSAQPPRIAPLFQQRNEDRRAARIDASNLASAGQQRELRGLQIEGARRELSGPIPAEQQALIRAGIFDTFALSDMLKQSANSQAIDPQKSAEILREAGGLAISIRDKMDQVGGDTSQLDRVMNLMLRDPAAGAEFLDTQVLNQLSSQLTDELFRDVKGGQREVRSGEFIPGETQEADRSIVQIMRSDGTIDQGFEDGQGNFFDNQNRPITLGEGDRAVRASLTGSAEDLGLSNTEMEKLRNSEVSTRNLIGSINEAKALIQNEPNINTITAQASAITNGLKAELRALSTVAGFEFKEELFNPSNYEGTFSELGISNVRMRGLITGLAYELATSREGGRLSDRDVQNAIKEIGGTSSDPVAFVATLDDVARRAENNFRNNFKVRTQSDFPGDLGRQTTGGQEEQTATNPQTGQKIVFRDGRWVDAQTGEPVQ